MLAGLAVAAAITLGAWVVYVRACNEKLQDLQMHLGELGERISLLSADRHRSMLALPPERRAPAIERQSRSFVFIRDHSEDARRIYSFSLDDDEPLTLLDTGLPGSKPMASPLSAHAMRARDHFKKAGSGAGRWIEVDGLETTAFSPIFAWDRKIIGIFGLEADTESVVRRLKGIEQSFLFTSLLGLVVGSASGSVMLRVRRRSARAQVQIAETRRLEEETLRLFFDETATAHFAFDGDILVDANPASVLLFGARDKDALLAQPVWALWPRRQPTHALSAEGWADHVMAALETGASHFDWQFCRVDGSPVECDVFLRHTIFQGRDVLLVACYDVSAAKGAQARLVESEQRFRDVSEAIGEFIWEVDREGRYTYASRRVKEVLGLEPEAVLGRTPFEFVPDEDLDSMRVRSDEIFHSGLAFRNFEHRVRRADGSLLWISASGVPSYDANGTIAGYRGASLDITNHRAYEQELVLQKEAAEAADRAKSNFLAMMSHEIRTPLNSVLGFADLMLGTPLDATQREHLRTIRSSGDALLVLLNDILDFSKIESGRMEVEIVATDLACCVREVLELYQLDAAEKKIALRSAISADVPSHVLTDSSRLRQILVNLVGNAVKFTAAGEVRVAISLVAPNLRFVVTDTGIGITGEQRERLFQPFTQADSSTTRRFGGTGLGLAISRRLAVLLGGHLDLADHAGPGSAFFFELPARPASVDQVAALVGPPEVELFFLEADGPQAGPPRRVLVVDDNVLNRRLTSKLLEQLGAETDTAASAEESFAKLATERFDLVLMDVQMPGMDGLEATRRIRAEEAAGGRAPAIIAALTADAMVGDRERCLAAGMNDYLTKPLRREALARVLRGLPA